MAFTVAALRETAAGERRVAITPETARKWQAAGASVLLETAAGLAAGFPDEAYPDVIFTDAQAVVGRLRELTALAASVGQGPALLVIGNVVEHSSVWKAEHHRQIEVAL